MTTTDNATTTARNDAHETAGPPVLGDVDSFASHAELARTLIEPGAMATLSTLTRTGHPYGSSAPYSAFTDGAPLICVSSMAEHTQYLFGDPRASVLVESSAGPGIDPLSVARVTILGAFVPTEPSDAEIDAHLDLHPFTRQYVHFADFSWWRLEILNLRYVGGFGVMGWSSGDEYAEATADPIIPFAPPMIEHLDADHAEACVSIVRHLAGVTGTASAPVSSIDRYGMTFDAHGADDQYLATARVAFPAPLVSPDQVRAASVDLVRRAAAAAGD